MQLSLSADWSTKPDYGILHTGVYDAIVATGHPSGTVEAAVFKYDGEIARKHGFQTIADAQKWAEQIIITDNI